MSISTFIVTLHTNTLPAHRSDKFRLAKTIEAALYKTYANPSREDDGITTVEAQVAIVAGDNPRTWRVAG